MALDEQLLEVLACPADRTSPLARGTVDDPAAEVLRCPQCGRTYPVDEDIPVLLIDEDDA